MVDKWLLQSRSQCPKCGVSVAQALPEQEETVKSTKRAAKRGKKKKTVKEKEKGEKRIVIDDMHSSLLITGSCSFPPLSKPLLPPITAISSSSRTPKKEMRLPTIKFDSRVKTSKQEDTSFMLVGYGRNKNLGS